MKKGIVGLIILLTVSFGFGKGILTNLPIGKKNTATYFFLQEGIYSDEDTLKKSLVKISKKIIDKRDNKYYVYVGITKDKDIAEKIQKIYEKKGFSIYPVQRVLSSEEFSTNVDQFDLLIKDTEEEEQILTIEEVVLASYEEMIKRSSKNS